MRILFANPIGALGGAELFLLEIMQELRARAPDWDLHLVTGGDGPLLERATDLGATCHLLPFPDDVRTLGDSSAHGGANSGGASTIRLMGRLIRSGRSGYGYVQRFRRLCGEISPDIVHSNGLKFHAVTGLAGCRPAKLCWLMHDYLGSRRFLSRTLPRLSGAVSLVWANSESVAADAHQLMPGRRIEVLHPGIDLEEFAPGPSDGSWLDAQCGRLPSSSDLLRIGLVATYARWKGQDVFLEAAAELVRRNPVAPVNFYIVGGPIYQTAGSQFSEDELRDLADSLALTDRVGFAPFQSDIARVYRSLDIVVHASRHPEPFGRTILEAMACARPVVAADAGGAAEIFSAGHDALGTAPGDVSGLADALSRLLGDPVLRRTLASRARTSALRFSRQRMGERLYQAYQELGGARTEARCESYAGACPSAVQLDSKFNE